MAARCYRVAVEAQALAVGLLAPEYRVLRDQLERASLSVVLNISEGAGRRSRNDKRRHYAIARGSAMEAAAAVHVIVARGIADAGACSRVRALYVRVVQMLSRLDTALSCAKETAAAGWPLRPLRRVRSRARPASGHVHVHGWKAL
jgi:four helix bundle protein